MKITREEESEIKGTPGVSAPAPTETPEQPAAAAKPATRWAAIPLWGRVLLILGIALLLLVFVGYAALQGMLGASGVHRPPRQSPNRKRPLNRTKTPMIP